MIEPSNGTIQSWKEKKSALESQLEIAKLGRDAAKNLSLLIPGFSIFKKIVANLGSDLSGHFELRNLLCSDLTNCESQEIPPESLLGQILVSQGISIYQRLAMESLQTILADLPDISDCEIVSGSQNSCYEVILTDRLGEADLVSINSIAELLLTAEDAQGDYRTLSDEVVRLEGEISKISARLNGIR